MDDREFFDTLYQMWVKTTGAEKCYWDYKQLSDGVCHIEAVEPDGWGHPIANHLEDPDADWITAVHGCFPDLIRRLNMALDEAERSELDRDARECRIWELESEVAGLKADLEGLING